MEKMYLYKLYEDRTSRTYDETLAVACMQGLANRQSPKIYVVCDDDENHRNGRPSSVGRSFGAPIIRPKASPWFWLDTLLYLQLSKLYFIFLFFFFFRMTRETLRLQQLLCSVS